MPVLDEQIADIDADGRADAGEAIAAETEEAFVVTLDCPGMKDEDFEVQAMGNQLILTGERSWEKEKKGKEFHRVESQYGRFERTVQLPENAMTEDNGIDAHYAKGVLTVTVPKRAKTPTTKIPVKSKK